MARTGKIARLPAAIREELNKRLRAGELGPQILPWLNSVPEVLSVVSQFFDGKPINAQNLSDWRAGGYKEWDQKQDRHWQRMERTRELAGMSMKLAQAGGGNLSEGAAAILGGEILGLLEQLDELRSAPELSGAGEGSPSPGGEGRGEGGTSEGRAAENKSCGDGGTERLKLIAESIDSLVSSVARIRRGDHDKEILRQNDQRLRQKDEELAFARERYQRDTAEAVLKSAKDEAVQRIAAAPMDHTAQLDAVGKHLFGELWK